MKPLEFVILSRFFSGLHESIRDKELKPTGIPAFINFTNYVSNSYDTTWIIACKTYQESSLINHKDHIFHINRIRFIVIPYKKYYPLPEVVNLLINDIIAFFKVYKHVGNKKKNKFIYSDRSNIIPLALLKRVLGFKTIIRILGMYPDQKRIVDSTVYKILHPLKFLAYRTKFDLAIGTQDGSGIEQFMDELINRNTPKHILINGSSVSPRIIKPDPKNIRLLYVGTLSHSKGIQHLLKSIKLLASKYDNFTLTVVGKGPLYQECKNFIEVNNLINHIRLMGAIKKSKLFEIYQHSDVYISINKLGNISNTVLEAAGAGLCMILLGADRKNKVDQFSEKFWGDNILYVGRKDLDKNLSKQIELILSNPTKITKYSKKIGIFAKANLVDWSDRIRKELNLILSVK